MANNYHLLIVHEKKVLRHFVLSEELARLIRQNWHWFCKLSGLDGK